MQRNTLLTFSVIMLSMAPAAPTMTVTNLQSARKASAVEIPFELVARHIMLKVKINNSPPLSFVFDTGDKVGIVDSGRAQELGLNLNGQIKVGGAGSEFLNGSFVKEASWTLPGLDGFSQPVTLAIPLKRLAARFGHDFDGIIGSDFIKQFVVEIDYEAKLLRLYDKDSFSYSGPGESVPIEFDGQGHPIIDADVTPLGGAPLHGKFVIDVGSSGGLALHAPFVVEHNLLSSGLKTIRAIGAGGAGGQSVGQIGRVSELKIGSYRIVKPTALFSQDEGGAMANKSQAGNIGQRMASKFRLFLDYSHKRIIFEPAASFNEPADRAFSGLALIGDDQDYTTFRITDVLESSPASEVGLQKDDVIVRVNETPAAALTLTKLNEMFERPVAYKLAVRRGDKTLLITLTPRKLV
jgi:hypothetical protein